MNKKGHRRDTKEKGLEIYTKDERKQMTLIGQHVKFMIFYDFSIKDTLRCYIFTTLSINSNITAWYLIRELDKIKSRPAWIQLLR